MYNFWGSYRHVLDITGFVKNCQYNGHKVIYVNIPIEQK